MYDIFINNIWTLLTLHIVAGVGGIFSFWIPVFTRKGGQSHIWWGKIYLYCMWTVIVTAVLLCLHNLLIGELYTAIFLGYLCIITGKPLWQGIAILRNKKSLSVDYLRISLLLEILLFVSGTALMVSGIFFVSSGIRYLMIFFGFIGFTGFRDIYRLLKGLSSTDWYRVHYSSLIVSGIAAYTAFLAFGGRQLLSGLLPGLWQIIPWVLPTLVGISIIRFMDRKRKKEKAYRSVS